jgi:cytochrome c553
MKGPEALTPRFVAEDAEGSAMGGLSAGAMGGLSAGAMGGVSAGAMGGLSTGAMGGLSALAAFDFAAAGRRSVALGPVLRQSLVAWWLWLAFGLAIGPAAADQPNGPPARPAVTPQEIEADWLHHDVLRRTGATSAPGVTPEEDALGGVDGMKNGKWGFHTENEPNPWWQVDLGKPAALERIVLYNRCDQCAGRNARILVLASDDAKHWKQLYQHDGTVFYGHSDQKPLSVRLEGATARFVRLQLPGTSYFHLDEVEIYPVGEDRNMALGRPATQSSTSQWSVRHAPPGAKAPQYEIAQVIRRGQELAESLRALGANVDAQVNTLRQVNERFEKLPARAGEPARRALYLEARRAVRKMALANPLLDFDTILFVKRVPPAFPHMSDQYYGWWSRPGGGIYLLEGFKTKGARVRSITRGWPEGSFLRPDLSYDGKRVLFAYAKFYPDLFDVKDKVNKSNLPEDAFYQIYEMNVDGTGVRRLTRGKYDDFDARYLADGDIVFLSTRKGQSVQVGTSSAAATVGTDLPDSYVRCGGDDWRPVPVFTLHRMDARGGNLRPISAFENFEWTPSVAGDGRILYARWDYIDRFNGPFMSLWSTNPDGTNPQLVYGNFTSRPQCVFEARSVPNSRKLVFTAAAHHSNMGGSLVLLDRTRGTELERPLERLTPEVCFPETEGWPEHYYANPYPLSEQFFLVSWSDRRLPRHTFLPDEGNPPNPLGIYLYDAFGNLELLHRDPEIASMYPLPVRRRRRPPVLPETSARDGRQEGRFLVQDIYRGLEGIERGSIKWVRIIGVPPKVQPQMNSPVLGVSREDPGKFVLGTAPVEADGSAFFRVPSGVSLFFQALDSEGLAVQTMRSLTYVQPNQTLSCIGCHEHRDTAPPARAVPLAALREPSKLTPGPPGSWPLRYDELVQPVLDQHCAGCHGPEGTAKAPNLDLTAANSYQNLISYAGDDLKNLAFEKDRSIVGDCPARKSKLLALLTEGEGHEGVRLDAESQRRLVTWMDTYAQRQGFFSEKQADDLRLLRRQWTDILTSGAD